MKIVKRLLRHGLQLLTIVTSVYSFLVVYLIGVGLAMFPLAMAIAINQNDDISLAPLDNWVTRIAFLLACIIALYWSFPVARFISRVFPIQAYGKRRYGFILACALFTFLILFQYYISPILGGIYLFFPPIVLLNIAALSWTILWQVRTTRELDKPFILFLRRFSSFSDRSVLNALLASRPGRSLLSFLVPPEDKPANLSPVVVAFSGMSLLRPMTSRPVAIQARNVDWEDYIEDLAKASSCAVIDPSFPSPGIDREIEIILRTKEPEKVLWLLDKKAEGKRHLPLTSTDLGEDTERRVIQYRRSWKAAIPRIVMEMVGLAISASIAIIIYLGNLIGNSQISSAVPSWIVLLAIGLFFFVLGAPIIFQPSVDRRVKRQMKSALNNIIAGDRRLEEIKMRYPWQTRKDLCCIICPEGEKGEKRALFLSRAISSLQMNAAHFCSLGKSSRVLRDAIRIIYRSKLVIADVSSPDPNVQYLLGVAQGMGRRVVLVADHEVDPERGTVVYKFVPDSKASSVELAKSLEHVPQEYRSQGPVAELLSDEIVFGERLAWRRFTAFILDFILSLGLVFAYELWRSNDFFQRELWFMTFFLTVVLVFIAYRFVFLALTDTTLGMYAMGLKLISTNGGPLRLMQALGRSLAFLLNFLYFFHYLLALYGPRHQVLEDVLSNTRVIRKRWRKIREN